MVYSDKSTGDQIAGCWSKDGFEWVLLMNNVEVLENRLDPTKYRFESKFPKRDLGIPTLKDYHAELPGCFSVGFEYGRVLSFEGDVSR